MIAYGEYLKRWDRIQEAEDKVRREFMTPPGPAEDGGVPTAWEPFKDPTPEQTRELECFGGDRYRLNAELVASSEYFDRLEFWRVTINGPCGQDQWTSCPPVAGRSESGDMACDLEADLAGNKQPEEWEPPRTDLRQQAHDFVAEVEFSESGSGGGFGGWDIGLSAMTGTASRRAVDLLSHRFAAEIKKGHIVIRRYMVLTQHQKLTLC